MRGRPSVWVRAHRLEVGIEAKQEDPALRRLTEDLAAKLGIDPAELRAEAEAFESRCRAAGAHTLEAVVALAAAEEGVEPEVLRAELEAITARRGA